MADEARAACRRNRLATCVAVATVLVASHALISDPERRATHQYLLTITLGYGHLIGAVSFARARLARLRVPGVPPGTLAASALVGVLSLFASYTWALQREPSLVVPLLGISVWHIVENDLALGRAYAGRLRLGPLPRSLDHHGIAAGFSAAVVLLAASAPDGLAPRGAGVRGLSPELALWARAACLVAGGLLLWRHGVRARGLLGLGFVLAGTLVSERACGWITLPDLFTATTLYHLISWLLFFADRSRALVAAGEASAAARMRRQLLWVHALPMGVCAGLLLTPGDWLCGLRVAVFSPAIYLFWSAAHVVQTIVVRGIEPRRRAARLPHPV